MNKFLSFMYGRRGFDALSGALIVFYVALSFILRFLNIGWFFYLCYIPLLIAIYRILSKDIAQREKENCIFVRFWGQSKIKFKKASVSFKNHQTYKYFRCPVCKQKLRAPRGKGKIKVRCQTCQKEFIKKV